MSKTLVINSDGTGTCINLFFILTIIIRVDKTINIDSLTSYMKDSDKQVGFFKKKPMKRSASVCYKRFLML